MVSLGGKELKPPYKNVRLRVLSTWAHMGYSDKEDEVEHVNHACNVALSEPENWSNMTIRETEPSEM